MMTLGEKIRQLRQAKGFSQEELAAHLNVSRQAVSKWEKSLSYPDTENLLALAALFEVSADELAGIRREEQTVEGAVVTETSVPEPQKNRNVRGRVVWMLLTAALLTVAVWAAMAGESKTPALDGGNDVPGQPELPEPPSATEPVGTESVAPAEEISEFTLLWETENGQEQLSVGVQERLFPFGTSLVPTEIETVSDTDFSSVKLYTVTCGALHLQYRRVREDAQPERDVLAYARTITIGYETPRNIGVGSDEAELLRRYDDELIYELKDSGSDILCRHDYKYIYAPETAFGAAVIFYISGGHVAGVEARAGDDMGNEAWHLDHMTRFPVKDGKPDFSHRKEPEREEVDATRTVYISLYSLQNDANLSAEEQYHHRRTIYENLQYLDWQSYGKMGEAGKDDLTRTELLRWLKWQTTLSADEISGLLAGACRSNLDGWVTESYANALGQACAAYPVEFIKAMAAEEFSDAERETVFVMTAHACAGQAQILEKILPALEGDPLRYTAEERVWAEELARRIREIDG